MKISRRLVVTVFCVLVLALAACSTEQLQQASADLKAAGQALDETKGELAKTREEIAAAGAKGEDVRKADKIAAGAEKVVDVAGTVVTKAGEVVAGAADTAGLIEGTAAAVAPHVPGGYGPLILLGATTIAAFIRARQNLNTARDIARGVEAGKDSSGRVDLGEEKTKAKVKSVMGARADRVVDEVRGIRKPALI